MYGEDNMKDISNKRILRYFIAVMIMFIILFTIQTNKVLAYSEDINFNGGGTFFDSSTKGGDGGAYGIEFGVIQYLEINTDNVKILNTIYLTNSYWTYYQNPSVQLNSNANGINQKLVTFSSNVGGINYGNGSIGWIRTSGNNFKYYILFDDVNVNYAKTLSGIQGISLIYNHSVFSNYFTVVTLGTDNGKQSNYNYVRGDSAIFSSSYGWQHQSFTAVQVGYSFNDLYNIYWNNVTNSTILINITKNSNNGRVKIYNQTYYTYYDTTNTNFISELFNKESGLFLLLNDTVANDQITRTIFSASTVNNPISGNINTSKSDYNLTEIVNISYNLTLDNTVTDSKIKIRLPTLEIVNNFITSGNNQFFNFYLPANYPIGTYTIYLQYEKDNAWFTLDTKIFNVSSINHTSFIKFLYPNYDLSQRLDYQYFTNQSGYITVNDSNGNIMQNTSSLNQNVVKELTYNFKQSDITGIWTANLYDSSGNLSSTDNTYINFGIVDITPIPVPVPDVTDISLLNIVAPFSQAVVGHLDTDNNGNIQDTIHNKGIGMNVLYFLILLVFLIFVVGTYRKITGKK